MRQPRKFTAIWPTGEITREEGVSDFAKRHGLTSTAISRCINGDIQSHKGWKFREQSIHDPPSYTTDQPPPADEPVETGVIDLAAATGMTRDQRLERAMKMRENLISKHARILAGETEMPVGWNPDRMMKPIEAEFRACGVDMDKAVDERTPEEIAADAIASLIDQPDTMFSMEDSKLDAIESAINSAITLGEEYIEDKIASKVRRADKGKASAAVSVMRQWLSRLRRLRTIRNSILIARPNEYDLWSKSRQLAHDATRVLRYMAYVGRSDTDDAGRGLDATILQYGKIHAKMAIDHYCACERIAVTAMGVYRPGDELPNGRNFPGIPYEGVLLLYPPRHSKSTFLRHVVGLTMGLTPRKQGAYVHAKADEASRFVKYVAGLFDPQTGAGARHLSLFPASLAAYDNNAHKVRLLIPEPTSNPTFMGGGVEDQALGNNLDYIIFDDVVPADDMTQESKREGRKRRVSGTWMSRLQSRNSTWVLAGYPWHMDDVLCDMRKQAKRAKQTNGREGRMILVSAMPVGGPSTSPPFRPIWPDVWPASRLKQRYRTTSDAAIWSANFMLQPISDEHRIVRRVEYYDAESEQHRRFLESAEFHLSVDPAMTKKEYSDDAGLVLVAVGDVSEQSVDEDGLTEYSFTRLIRVLESVEIKSTQVELSDTIAAIAASRKIDMVHMEVKGGGYAVMEFLECLHGISGVMPHQPGNTSKEVRLRAVASMLEADSRHTRPTVQFVGRPIEDGRILQHESMKKLTNYIINFRATSGHHGLDALTQVLTHLRTQVQAGGGGEVTVQARKKMEESPKMKSLREIGFGEQERSRRSHGELISAYACGYGA